MPASTAKTWISPRAVLRSIVGIDDTHHSIALGTAIGMCVGMTPTVGLQMVIVVVVALLTRPFFHFNRLAALLTVYISNPLTIVPIYYFLYWVGTFFVPGTVSRSDFEEVLNFEGWRGWLEALENLFLRIGTPLLIGTAIVATISGLATYPLMRWLLKWLKRPSPE